MKHPQDALTPVASWIGTELTAAQVAALTSYAEWLITEAVAIGGIGPAEPDRIWQRHIVDSLTFGHGLAEDATVLDVGTGVGLPGIPLAIAFPGTDVTLLDRSTRRTDALHRIARILDIPARIVTSDIRDHHGGYRRLVMRAALRTERMAELRRLVLPGGDIVVGGGRGAVVPTPPDGVDILRINHSMVENGAWLLRMPVE